MENLSLGGHLIPEWFCFWMSWWFLKACEILNRNIFTVTFNQILESDFKLPEHQADGQDGTWITNDMIEAYCKLNELGIAKSIEVWQNEELVGGLYGIDLGRIFCGKYVF
jgi:leucyl/phenylalanyl-tRNA--protein transferase